jgi:hypothetical protein
MAIVLRAILPIFRASESVTTDLSLPSAKVKTLHLSTSSGCVEASMIGQPGRPELGPAGTLGLAFNFVFNSAQLARFR